MELPPCSGAAAGALIDGRPGVGDGAGAAGAGGGYGGSVGCDEAAAGAVGDSALSVLVWPVPLQRFFADHWELAPLHIAASGDGNGSGGGGGSISGGGIGGISEGACVSASGLPAAWRRARGLRSGEVLGGLAARAARLVEAGGCSEAEGPVQVSRRTRALFALVDFLYHDGRAGKGGYHACFLCCAPGNGSLWCPQARARGGATRRRAHACPATLSRAPARAGLGRGLAVGPAAAAARGGPRLPFDTRRAAAARGGARRSHSVVRAAF